MVIPDPKTKMQSWPHHVHMEIRWAFQVCIAFSMAHVAYAQPTQVEFDSALTKLMVAEAGWTHTLDHTVMLFAIELLDEQESRSDNLLETLELHVQWWSKGYPPNRPWIAGLNTSCNKPEGFPTHLNWQRHQRWCIAIVGLVRAHKAGKLKNPCKGRPNNWRARGVASRKAKRLYYHVGCGRTLHNYFDTHRDPKGRRRK